jgi:hypothetical protein
LPKKNGGVADEGRQDADPECEVTLTTYRGGTMEGELIGYSRSNRGAFRWVDPRPR